MTAQTRSHPGLWTAGLTALLLPLATGCTQVAVRAREAIQPAATAQTAPATADDHVQALVKLGPRVAGTPTAERASHYLLEQFRQAGYVTEVQPFTYSKYEDLGSSLIVNGAAIAGQALNGSRPGSPSAQLVVVPNLGRPSDFARVNVKGAIALVRRGAIPFSQKASNAAQAGAIGVVIVNNEPGELHGTLQSAVAIPVLALSQESGSRLLQSPATVVQLKVNTRDRSVTGRNVIAHKAGVTQPSLILGAHYDSVPGSPGANDNASGTATVLTLAHKLAATPSADRTWFIAFDGEEDGLQGSRAFVRQAQPQFLAQLKGMVNFDMVGVNRTLHIQGSSSLVSLAQSANLQATPASGGDASDHASFAAQRVPILFFYRGMEPNYHKPTDRSVSPQLLDETVRSAVKTVQQITQSTR